MANTVSFYNELAKYYHLIYPDWEASILNQAGALSAVLERYKIGKSAKILDAACGIGTQVLGLAQLGYDITASDISEDALEQADRYAAERKLEINFQQADMRQVDEVFSMSFDVVIACDNAVPHLLSDQDILAAFKSFHKVLGPDGITMISVRDYARMELSGIQVHPRQGHEYGSSLIYLWDVWEFEGDQYSITIYLIQDDIGKPPIIQAIRGGKYYPVTIDRITSLFHEAGFIEVDLLREAYFQPLIVAQKTYQ